MKVLLYPTGMLQNIYQVLCVYNQPIRYLLRVNIQPIRYLLRVYIQIIQPNKYYVTKKKNQCRL